MSTKIVKHHSMPAEHPVNPRHSRAPEVERDLPRVMDTFLKRSFSLNDDNSSYRQRYLENKRLSGVKEEDIDAFRERSKGSFSRATNAPGTTTVGGGDVDPPFRDKSNSAPATMVHGVTLTNGDSRAQHSDQKGGDKSKRKKSSVASTLKSITRSPLKIHKRIFGKGPEEGKGTASGSKTQPRDSPKSPPKQHRDVDSMSSVGMELGPNSPVTPVSDRGLSIISTPDSVDCLKEPNSVFPPQPPADRSSVKRKKPRRYCGEMRQKASSPESGGRNSLEVRSPNVKRNKSFEDMDCEDGPDEVVGKHKVCKSRKVLNSRGGKQTVPKSPDKEKKNMNERLSHFNPKHSSSSSSRAKKNSAPTTPLLRCGIPCDLSSVTFMAEGGYDDPDVTPRPVLPGPSSSSVAAGNDDTTNNNVSNVNNNMPNMNLCPTGAIAIPTTTTVSTTPRITVSPSFSVINNHLSYSKMTNTASSSTCYSDCGVQPSCSTTHNATTSNSGAGSQSRRGNLRLDILPVYHHSQGGSPRARSQRSSRQSTDNELVRGLDRFAVTSPTGGSTPTKGASTPMSVVNDTLDDTLSPIANGHTGVDRDSVVMVQAPLAEVEDLDDNTDSDGDLVDGACWSRGACNDSPEMRANLPREEILNKVAAALAAMGDKIVIEIPSMLNSEETSVDVGVPVEQEPQRNLHDEEQLAVLLKQKASIIKIDSRTLRDFASPTLAYPLFHQTLERVLGDVYGLRHLAAVFQLTRFTVERVGGMTSSAARRITQFSERYLTDHYVNWIAEHGGWEIVADSTTDEDVD